MNVKTTMIFVLIAASLLVPMASAEEVWNGSVDLLPGTVNVTADNSGEEYTISSTCAMYATIRAAEAGGFNYSISDAWWDDYGSLYFDMIYDRHESGSIGWLYWVNYPDGSSPTVGSNCYELTDGDAMVWYWGSGMGTLPEDSDMLIRIKVAITERGDLNHDGTITPADAVIALQIAVRGGWLEAADMNCDGVVTSLDALMILQAVAVGRSRI